MLAAHAVFRAEQPQRLICLVNLIREQVQRSGRAPDHKFQAQTRWNRDDFIGVLDEQYLPDWAREKLEEIQAPKQSGPTMNM